MIRHGQNWQAETSKDRAELSNIINQLDLTDIYRSFLSNKAGYAFSSSSHRTFSEADPILDYRTHVNKFHRRGIIRCLPLDHSGIKLEVSNTKVTGQSEKGQCVLGSLHKHIFCKTRGHRRSRQASRGRTRNVFERNRVQHMRWTGKAS